MDERAFIVLKAGENPSSVQDFKVTVILKNVGCEKTIGDSPFSSVELFNLEPFSGPEKPLDMGLDLFQMEPKCD